MTHCHPARPITPRRHGGRRHRPGDHRRDARGAARGRPAVRARACASRRSTIGLAALQAHGTTLPDAAFEAAKAADGVILGPVAHNDYPPVEQGGLNPSGELRKRLDLYANIRPAKTRGGFPPRCGVPVDLVIVRENTEGFYADRNMFHGLRRVHADAGPRALGAQDHARRLDPHRRGRLRAGACAGAGR